FTSIKLDKGLPPSSWQTCLANIRKPFDVLAEGPSVLLSRGDRTPVELFVAGATTLLPEIPWPISSAQWEELT
ncbi:MAG: hypothetical protein DWQ46_20670, partial [Planctomycetota bacterium]